MGGSFALLHDSQQAFKEELDRLQDNLAPGGYGGGDGGGVSFKDSFKAHPPPNRGASFKNAVGRATISDAKRASFGPSEGSSAGASPARGSVLGRAGVM